ncbi:MAG: hypothetical protein KAG66_15385, partial [Methylococcales bacterium]|nr:hypothetical protein [Methylococcales bacterium]
MADLRDNLLDSRQEHGLVPEDARREAEPSHSFGSRVSHAFQNNPQFSITQALRSNQTNQYKDEDFNPAIAAKQLEKRMRLLTARERSVVMDMQNEQAFLNKLTYIEERQRRDNVVMQDGFWSGMAAGFIGGVADVTNVIPGLNVGSKTVQGGINVGRALNASKGAAMATRNSTPVQKVVLKRYQNAAIDGALQGGAEGVLLYNIAGA